MKLTQPTWPRRLPAATVVALATLGPVGQRLPAPGTWGSVVGVLGCAAVGGMVCVSTWEILLISAVGFWLAVGLCGEAEIRLGKTDPGEVILDEVVAMPLCFLGWYRLTELAPAWAVLLAGFAVFRFFDILKPLGIARLQNLPGGWGVVVDDTAAALATCATLHLGRIVWLVVR